MFGLFTRKQKETNEDIVSRWEKEGKPIPPPHIIKQRTVIEYKNRFNLNILVETGTYLGEMVEAQKNNFSKIYSIELSERLFKKAKKKFSTEKNIILICGDSGIKLHEIITELQEPALFWLDGHYSKGITALGEKECPVREELSAIFKSAYVHIILIDDARMFDGTHDYPTIDEIKTIISEHRKDYKIEIQNDIIRLTP